MIEHLREEREQKMWQQRQQGTEEVDMEQEKLHKYIENTMKWKTTEDQRIQETKKKISEEWAACELR